jgi:hypothetical protein
VTHDEGYLYIDRCTGCESSFGVCFDSRLKIRSRAKSDPVLSIGVPGIPKYYVVRKDYRQGIFFSLSECEHQVRGFPGC